MKPLAIIGLDPGTTAGYVVLGLEGQVITSAATKNLPLSAIIAAVMEVCQPIIVATDKARVPSLVEEFSRKLGAEIVSPEQDLTREEKRQLLQEHNYYYKSHHQQDSVAAALFAYKRYRPRIEKINRYLAGNNQNNLQDHEQEFTKIALKEDLHFALIKELLTSTGTEQTIIPIIRSVIQENRITKKDFLVLYQRLVERVREKALLERRVKELHTTISQLQHQLRRAQAKSGNVQRKIERLFQFKENRLRQLQRQQRQQQEALTNTYQERQELFRFIAEASRYCLIKKLKTLSEEEFREKKNLLAIDDGDVLFVQNTGIYSPKVIAALQDKNILLLSQKISKGLRHCLPCAEFQEKFIRENEHFALIEHERIERYRPAPKIDVIVRDYRDFRQANCSPR